MTLFPPISEGQDDWKSGEAPVRSRASLSRVNTTAASALSDAPLASTRIGEGSRRVAFLHGLRGRGRNVTGPAKELGDDFTVELIDLPDHGASPWTDRVDYREIADRVAAHLRAGLAADGPVHLLGHSMGGKVAMVLALRHPDLVDRLIVEDISPRVSPQATDEFVHLLGTMLRMDLDAYDSRAEADAAMAEHVHDARVRGALLSMSMTLNLVIASADIMAPPEFAWPVKEVVWDQRFSQGQLRTFPSEFLGWSVWAGLAMYVAVAVPVLAWLAVRCSREDR